MWHLHSFTGLDRVWPIVKRSRLLQMGRCALVQGASFDDCVYIISCNWHCLLRGFRCCRRDGANPCEVHAVAGALAEHKLWRPASSPPLLAQAAAAEGCSMG